MPTLARVSLGLGAAVALAIGVAARSQPEPAPAPKATGPAAIKPSEAHSNFEPLIGEWTMAWTMHGPEGQRNEFAGRQTNAWVVGGRWMQTTFETDDDIEGEKFGGIGYFGHDNTTGEYHNVWFENSRTAVQYDTGSYDPEVKQFSFTGTQPSARTGRRFTTRTTIRIIDNDRHDEALYVVRPGGEEVLVLEIVCTRVR